MQNPLPFTFGTFHDTFWQDCTSPYEATTQPDGKPNPELSDAPCYPKGFTHGALAPPNMVAGCIQTIAQNGDLDYDGTSYWPNWPNSVKPNKWPSPFLQLAPTTRGHTYPRIQFQTNAAASESSCQPTGVGCAVPPPAGAGQVLPVLDAGQGDGQCVLGVRADAKRQHVRPHASVRRTVGVLLRQPRRADPQQPELLSFTSTSTGACPRWEVDGDTWPPGVHLEFLEVVQSAVDFHSTHSHAMFLVLEDARACSVPRPGGRPPDMPVGRGGVGRVEPCGACSC